MHLNLNDERLVDNLSDESREIIEHCIYQLGTHIPTEEPLTFEEIVYLVNAEDTENTENTIDDSNEETSPVQLKEARIGLETAFKFFEQQPNDVGIDVSDLRVFRKYMNLLNLKKFQSKRQQSIDAYFSAS
ncbi:2749_t:CDS:2 [Paraglomus brasilianum]|uniref:2749_t:CDS:1 n=1 Tax=Paraglomus brasilianum TaxID=144538 RepID=A0A9N9GU55_9GLOM|nr:2749_t:CDS:2 [Paraglomus brasilianum]